MGGVTNSGLVNITNSQQGVEFLGQLYGSNVNIANTAANSTIKFGGDLALTGQIVTSLNNYNVDILELPIPLLEQPALTTLEM